MELKVVELVRKHIDPKVFWRVLDVREQKLVLQELFRDICQLYGVEGVELVIELDPLKYRLTGGGCYVPLKRRIYLHKISLMTFLHEVAHMLLGPSERKARLWSHKVFYLAFPKLYMKNAQEGKFFHSFPIEEIVQFSEGII
uniref:IrrE N-terminal-like domain-containing protein n=1 Tax=Thermocrinis ruber TaxID=75906 RepID=A0A7C5X495_9AQUI